MIDARLLFGAAALCATVSMNADAKLYKWVDENGTTHYGETIPPEYANRDPKQLEKGRIVDRDEKPDPGKKGSEKREVVKDRATIEAERHDNALLATYSNEKEIDLARDRNLLQVEARVNSYATMLKSAEASLAGLLQERDAINKNGRKTPASLIQDIADAEALVARRKKELATANKEVEAVKARYAADKQRYRELKGISPAAR